MKTITHNCPKCNTKFNAWSKWGIKKFCSRTCGNSRGPRPEETKQKISKKLTGRIGHSSPKKGQHIVERIAGHCLCCGIEFFTRITQPRKYCSNDCWKKQSGGYRIGSGRSNSGYYKGIYCGSTYELCWVIHSLDHGVEFTRFDGLLERDGIKYYPDFLLADGKTIIETKGFEKQESVDKKTTLAESFGYTVTVLRKDDLQYAFDYVKEKYSTTEYKTLYDGYKPKYSYVCSHCSTEFSRDKKLKTDVVFCSRTCTGKGHKGRVTHP
jgi:DNA-directed RNA polymerase subunit RPC12/RpoP